MFPKRMFLTIVITAIVASSASAQSRGFDAKMSRGKTRVTPAIAASNNNSHDDDDDNNVRLEGTWRATEAFADGSVFRVLFTFGAGKNSNSGVVNHSDELFLVSAPSCLTAQGVWKKKGERNFIATDEGFCFDTNNDFLPDGKVKFKSAIRLNRQGSEFNGRMHIEGFDVNGVLVFEDDALLHAERMPAEAP
jgi:hypothetical protein